MSFNVNNKIIGFSGKLNAGKDFSAIIVQWLNTLDIGLQPMALSAFSGLHKDTREVTSKFKTVAFADKLKLMCSIATHTELESWSDRKQKDIPLPPPYNNYSRRTFMTTLGKSCRDMDPNFFSQGLFLEHRKQLGTIDAFTGEPIIYGDNWLITDVRFPNEIEAIHSRGGIVIRVDRPLYSRHGYDAIEDVRKVDPVLYKKLLDPSETALDDYNFKYKVTWEDDEEVLIDYLDNILDEHGITNTL